MNQTFRKTTQSLAPSTHTPPDGVFNIYPAQPIGPGQIELGFSALAQLLVPHQTIVIDGMGGVLWDDFQTRLTASLRATGVAFEWFDIREALLPESEINRLIGPFLGGDDPLFGTRNTCPLRSFFAPEKLNELHRRVLSAGRAIVYGTGAALAGSPG